MERLLDMVDAGQVRAVLVAKLDRLTRSVKYLCTLLERFERNGVALVSFAESLDTSSDAGRLVLNIMTMGGRGDQRAHPGRSAPQAQERRVRGEPRLRRSALRWQAFSL